MESTRVSIIVQEEDVYLHREPEFWMWLIANSNHADNF